MPGLNDTADRAWVATRVKAQLDAADRSMLTTLKRLYAGDRHLVAMIDALLGP